MSNPQTQFNQNNFNYPDLSQIPQQQQQPFPQQQQQQPFPNPNQYMSGFAHQNYSQQNQQQIPQGFNMGQQQQQQYPNNNNFNNNNNQNQGFFNNQYQDNSYNNVGYNNDSDYESNNGYQFQEPKEGGLEASSRIQFIRKVYLILLTQITITVFMCFYAMKSPNFKNFAMQNMALFYFAFAGSLITCIALSCYRELARSVPTNYILLAIFTVCEAYIVSSVVVFYPVNIVLWAASLTLAIFVGLTSYAFYTKTDFTFMGGFLFCALAVMMVAGLLLMFIPSQTATLIYSILGVMLFSVYLIFDTQLILGKFGNKFDIDDYIIAALNVYLDIINLFLYILQILASSQN